MSSEINHGTSAGDPSLLSNNDLIRQQQQAIKEQDEGLDALSSVIARQKQMSHAIYDEVTDQNALIDDIDDMTDHTSRRIKRETHNVNIIRQKSSTCGFYVIIILLLLVIIIIASIPTLYM